MISWGHKRLNFLHSFQDIPVCSSHCIHVSSLSKTVDIMRNCITTPKCQIWPDLIVYKFKHIHHCLLWKVAMKFAPFSCGIAWINWISAITSAAFRKQAGFALSDGVVIVDVEVCEHGYFDWVLRLGLLANPFCVRVLIGGQSLVEVVDKVVSLGDLGF